MIVKTIEATTTVPVWPVKRPEKFWFDRDPRSDRPSSYPIFRYEGEYIRDYPNWSRLVWLTEEQAAEVLGCEEGHLRNYINKCFTQLSPGLVIYNHDGQFGLYYYRAR